MNLETEQTNKKLEETNLTQEKIEHPFSKKRYITIVITNFQYFQADELVNHGIGRSVSDFTRDAFKERINQHKHLLPDKFLAPKEKAAYKRRRKAILKKEKEERE
jgi:hypothetical protein